MHADFTSKTMRARRLWDDTFKVPKEKKKMSTPNPTASENIPLEWEWNKNMFRQRSLRVMTLVDRH